MATFAEVKDILDSLVKNVDLVRMRNKHGGDRFSWDTAEKLRSSVARIVLDEYRLIDPRFVNNGQADQTYLVRLLVGPLPEEGLPQMPRIGTLATPAQIQVIRDWINEGARDDAPPAERA